MRWGRGVGWDRRTRRGSGRLDAGFFLPLRLAPAAAGPPACDPAAASLRSSAGGWLRPRRRRRPERSSSGLSMPSTAMRGISRPISFSIAATPSPSSRRGQGEGAALAAGAAGAADAVDIILGIDRHVEIEDVAEGRRCRGRAPRRRWRPGVGPRRGLKALQRLGALGLRHVAVQRADAEAVLLQRLVQDVHVALAVAEDEGVLHVLGADQPAQRLALVCGRHDDEALRRSSCAARPAARR